MNSSRRKFAAILEALGVPPSSRRSATPAAPACEPLEGRQLLAGGLGLGLEGLGMAGFGGGMADVSSSKLGGPALDGSGGGVATGATGLGSGTSSTPVQSDLEQLQSDTQAIHDKSMVTPAMQYTVTADVKAIKSAETTLPNPAAQAILKVDAKAAMANAGGPTDQQVALVTIAQEAVYASQGVSPTLIAQLNIDEAAVQAASGVTAGDEATLAADQAAITVDQAKLKAAPTTMTPTTTSTTPTSPSTAIPATSAIGLPATGTDSGSFAGSLGGRGMTDTFGHGTTGLSGIGGIGSGSFGMSSTPGMPGMDGLGFPEMFAAGGQASSTTAAPTISAALTADLTALKLDGQKLQIDTEAVHDKSMVTPMMEAAVRADLEAIKGAESSPAGATAEATLKADVKAGQANTGGPTAAQMAQVQADRDALYESEGVNAALVTKLDTDEATVKTASNVTASDSTALAADMAAVKADQAQVKTDSPAPTTPTTTDAASTTTTATTATPTTPPMDFGRFPGRDRMNDGGFAY